MRVLVTGAGGFIGSHVVEAAVRAGVLREIELVAPYCATEIGANLRAQSALGAAEYRI